MLTFSQSNNYEEYYLTINLAEKKIASKEYKVADSLYRTLTTNFRFFQKDLFNASKIAKLANTDSSVFDSLLMQQNNSNSKEVLNIYKRDQNSRKFLGKFFTSKEKRIKAMNWIDCLAVILYIGIAAIIIYKNRDKKKYYGEE